MSEEKQYYFLYKITNLINNKIYAGVHSTNNIDDGYFGSSTYLNMSIKKHGKENFKREILQYFDSKDAMYTAEELYVNEEFINRDDTYNMKVGGIGGWNAKGMVTVKDELGNYFQVPVDDPDYLSGKLVGVAKGMISVKDKNGITMSVPVDDPDYLSGELMHHTKGMVTVKDFEGNTMSVPIDHPDYLNGTLVSIAIGMVVVKDIAGKIFKVPVDHPDYLSGKLLHNTKGKVVVKDSDGNIFQVDKNHPDYLSGKLIHVNKGRKNKMKLRTCPHCGVEGKGGNMTRWHFNNCKFFKLPQDILTDLLLKPY